MLFAPHDIDGIQTAGISGRSPAEYKAYRSGKSDSQGYSGDGYDKIRSKQVRSGIGYEPVSYTHLDVYKRQ